MKVEYKKSNDMSRFGFLKIGDVFIIPSVAKGKNVPYIKIPRIESKKSSLGGFNAVELETGALCAFTNECYAEQVECTLVIESIK